MAFGLMVLCSRPASTSWKNSCASDTHFLITLMIMVIMASFVCVEFSSRELNSNPERKLLD
jgi:hypothetical protein